MTQVSHQLINSLTGCYSWDSFPAESLASHLSLSQGEQGSKHSGPDSLLSQAHEQVAALKAEQWELQLAV